MSAPLDSIATASPAAAPSRRVQLAARRWRAAGTTSLWLALVGAVALLPFARGLSASRVFYVRDLSSFFWGRYLWLRHEWLAGHWPLWDPHVGAGQAAYSDALNQMFLPPSVLVRLLGNEALGFNLWVLTPFPIAACGAWLLLSRRSSRPAAAVGALAFALCGPIVSTGDFPNLSWSVAMLPWVVWATDRLIAHRSGANLAILALCSAVQCLSGEPVTFFTTCLVALAYAATPSDLGDRSTLAARIVNTTLGFALGVGLAAIQVVPMVLAAIHADRGDTIRPDSWSLRPTALLETVWHHLSGDYFTASSLQAVPWMTLLNEGREPLLFSLYLGTPLMAAAVLGLAGPGPRRWRLFWVGAGFCSLVLSFGSYTPIYPVLRDYVPPFGTFRFPVKYIIVAMLALASGVAMGIDHLLAPPGSAVTIDARRHRRGVVLSVLTAAAIVLSAATTWTMCVTFPAWSRHFFESFARMLGSADGHAAAEVMMTSVAAGAPAVLLLGGVSAILVSAAGSSVARVRTLAALALALTMVIDLQVHAWGINPVIDVTHLRTPEWASYTDRDRNARFYVGGKLGGSLEAMDFDSSRGFLQTPGLTAAGSRAVLNAEAAFYPSGWGGRELLSYDLAVVWPREYGHMMKRFERSTREERDAFLDRTGVRFRILPSRRSHERTPLIPLRHFLESYLFDWGPVVATRASIVPTATLVGDPTAQLEALFTPQWHAGEPVVIDRELAPAGTNGPPGPATADIVMESSDRLQVSATTGAAGGYLVLLDSYSDDWRTLVDGSAAPTARAYGVFRAVHLMPGTHTVRFEYAPRALRWGGMISIVAGLLLVALIRIRTATAPL